jgi:hypothetical protein
MRITSAAMPSGFANDLVLLTFGAPIFPPIGPRARRPLRYVMQGRDRHLPKLKLNLQLHNFAIARQAH